MFFHFQPRNNTRIKNILAIFNPWPWPILSSYYESLLESQTYSHIQGQGGADNFVSGLCSAGLMFGGLGGWLASGCLHSANFNGFQKALCRFWRRRRRRRHLLRSSPSASLRLALSLPPAEN